MNNVRLLFYPGSRICRERVRKRMSKRDRDREMKYNIKWYTCIGGTKFGASDILNEVT